MASYTSISKAEAQSILSLYGDYEIIELSPLSLGISNSNYCVRLKNHAPLVLKISNDKNAVDLKEEQKILMKLSQSQFPLSLTPLKTKKEEVVYECGKYHGVIYPFIEGKIPQIEGNTCLEVGKALATLHNLNINDPILRGYQSVGFGAMEVLTYTYHPECPLDFKTIFNEIFPDKLKKYIELDLPLGLIHGDFYYDNSLFDNEGLKIILDFEQAGIGPYLFDVGVSISGTCLKNGHVDADYVAQFLKGYESIRTFEEEEKENLNTSILLGLYSIALWRIKRFNERQIDPTKKDNYKELILRAQNFYQKIKNE